MHMRINRLVAAAFLCVLAGGTLAWLLLGIPSSGINDADIYLVYAQNYLGGHGFVYNIGDGQLEGFPSLLWMLVCTVVYIFFRTPELPLLMLNLTLGITTVYICLKRSNQKTAFMVLLCSAPAWFAWSQIALVEWGLWCLLLTASILAVSERDSTKCTWLLPLLLLTRPEAMLWGCWLLLVLFLGLVLDRGSRRALRAGFRPLFTFGTTWAVLILFRGLYFGSILPSRSSTLPAHEMQINIGSGPLYLLGYLFSNPAVLLTVLVFCWVFVREINRNRRFSRALAVCICLLPGLIIPLITGDESFRAFRLYQPIWPLLCLVAAWALPLLYERMHRPLRHLAPAALMLTGWLIFALSSDLKAEFSTAGQGREHGVVLARMFEHHEVLPSIGTLTPGACKYSYSGNVYELKELIRTTTEPMPPDPLGTDDTSRFDRTFFYEHNPDILIQSASSATDPQMFMVLQSERWFQQRYLKGELWYNDEILSGYFSRRLLDGLAMGHYAFCQDLRYALNMEEPQEISVALTDPSPAIDLAASDRDELTQELQAHNDS